MTDSVVKIITEATLMLNCTLETMCTFRNKMDRLSSILPEYEVIMELYCVGKVLGSQLIAEIGDIRHLDSSKYLVVMAVIDPPPNQSGQVDQKTRSTTKRGSPALRKRLFQIMTFILQNKPVDEHVYQFLNKKRSEGKPYRVYMIATAHKFLRIKKHLSFKIHSIYL